MHHVTALAMASLLIASLNYPAQAEEGPIDIKLTCEKGITADFHYAGGHGFIDIDAPFGHRKINSYKAGSNDTHSFITFYDGESFAKLAFMNNGASNIIALQIGQNGEWNACKGER